MSQFGLLREFWAFMRARKKWWLLPIIVVMLLVGSLLVFAQDFEELPTVKCDEHQRIEKALLMRQRDVMMSHCEQWCRDQVHESSSE